MSAKIPVSITSTLQRGVVIPAHPLALMPQGNAIDERRQRALTRYYLAAGAGGLAVGVHTTQFQIHSEETPLYADVLRLAAEEITRVEGDRGPYIIRVAGLCGDTVQAVAEAGIATGLGYHYGLINLSALKCARVERLLEHCRLVGEVIPLFGFYLQPRAGGMDLSESFWRSLCELESLRAIKVAPFDRYRTLEVMRAVALSHREDIALYTGNDDHIVYDLVTPYTFGTSGGTVTRRFVGGLLGQWAVGTRRAVELLAACHQAIAHNQGIPQHLVTLGVDLTNLNAAIFDASNNFHGCISGIHEALRQQGLLAQVRCLDSNESLSPGQKDEISRVLQEYPHLLDQQFIREHIDQWMG